MRLTRLYTPETLVCGASMRLDEQASRHLVRVLRTRIGSTVILFNGDGFNYRATTLDADPGHTLVSIEEQLPGDNESGLSITLIQGLSRHDRMETSIQKSVELGVNKIIPLLCQRSNVKFNREKQQKKHEHWRKVAISACEQSGRCVIPEILPVTRSEDLPALLSSQSLRLQLIPNAEDSLLSIKTAPELVEFIIGPEGGLAEEEIELMMDNAFQAIRFGPRVLRTETAGPAVISALQLLWGDFG